MCYFIIVAFPSESLAVARGLLRSACHMRETRNPSMLEALPAGWSAGYLSDEMCGCDMYANASIVPESLEERAEAFRRKHSKPKYRKRGWSDAKIERAVQQMQEDAERRLPSTLKGVRIDVRRAIASLVQSMGRARMIVHFFSDDVDEEAIPAETSSMKVDRFLNDPSAVSPDIWYEIEG